LQPDDVAGAAVVAAGAAVVVAGAVVVVVVVSSVEDAAVLEVVDVVVAVDVEAEPVEEAAVDVVVVAADAEPVELAAVLDAVLDAVLALEVAHVVASVGDVVNAVTVKSGVPPSTQVQHGSPKASPLVMVDDGNVVWQKSVDHVSSAASKAVAKSVYCELSLSGWPSSCEKSEPFGM
jgi:hypothetical protein